MARSSAAAADDDATQIGPPISAETREVLRRLELDVTRRLDGLLHGDHRGLVPGHGSELGETRRYAPGDDVRRIDWNVTARLPEAHIRQTIAERELQTWIVVDRSPRLAFGTAQGEKRDLVTAATAAVGFLTNRDGNRIGAVFAGAGEPSVIPPRGSRQHLLRLLHDVATPPPADGAGTTDLGAALGHVSSIASRRGLVVVVSDFLVAPGWERALQILARRQELLAIQVTDPRDAELPNVGLVALRDPATGKVREVATNKRKVRERFAAAAAERQEALAAELRRNRVEHLVLSTDRPWLDDLVRFVGNRKRRMGFYGGRA
ncbi:MAG: DUF58 domain-containing protein [Actinomycetota bacterium]